MSAPAYVPLICVELTCSMTSLKEVLQLVTLGLTIKVELEGQQGHCPLGTSLWHSVALTVGCEVVGPLRDPPNCVGSPFITLICKLFTSFV